MPPKRVYFIAPIVTTSDFLPGGSSSSLDESISSIHKCLRLEDASRDHAESSSLLRSTCRWNGEKQESLTALTPQRPPIKRSTRNNSSEDTTPSAPKRNESNESSDLQKHLPLMLDTTTITTDSMDMDMDLSLGGRAEEGTVHGRPTTARSLTRSPPRRRGRGRRMHLSGSQRRTSVHPAFDTWLAGKTSKTCKNATEKTSRRERSLSPASSP